MVSFVSTSSAMSMGSPPHCCSTPPWSAITGEHVEKAAALRELARAEREELYLEAEREVLAASVEARKLRASIPTKAETEAPIEKVAAASDLGDVSAADLVKRVLAEVCVIRTVATRSSNLKGTMVRDLKHTAASIKSVVEDLRLRTTSIEVRRLGSENDRLHQELTEFRREIVELRREIEESRRARISAPLADVEMTSVEDQGGWARVLDPDPALRCDETASLAPWVGGEGEASGFPGGVGGRAPPNPDARYYVPGGGHD